MNVARLIRTSFNRSLKLSTAPKVLKNHQMRPWAVASWQIRPVSTIDSKTLDNNEGFLKRLVNKVPFLDLNKTKMMSAGYLLYEGIADKINYSEFFEELQLADTFYSWFVVTELHIWMISVRAMAEGHDGRNLRNYIVQAFWADVAQRVKKLGAVNPSITRLQVSELSEQLQAALIAYDEGLQSDDIVLAGAIWRRFYQQNDINPKLLEVIVKYIRKHISSLDQISRDDLIQNRIMWSPIQK